MDRRSTAPGGPPARARILEAAAELFYRQGVRAVGVDTLCDASGVAKATFYHHFPSKDQLILAWLRAPSARWFDRVRDDAFLRSREGMPALQAFFQSLAEWLEADDFRGCAFLNTLVEIPDPKHPARDIALAYLEEVEAHFRDLLIAQDHPDPDALAAQLLILTAGAIEMSRTRRSARFALIALDAAAVLGRA